MLKKIIDFLEEVRGDSIKRPDLPIALEDIDHGYLWIQVIDNLMTEKDVNVWAAWEDRFKGNRAGIYSENAEICVDLFNYDADARDCRTKGYSSSDTIRFKGEYVYIDTVKEREHVFSYLLHLAKIHAAKEADRMNSSISNYINNSQKALK